MPGAGEGVEKYKQEILSLFVWKSRERVRVQESREENPVLRVGVQSSS